jgi:hypothetical protein
MSRDLDKFYTKDNIVLELSTQGEQSSRAKNASV